MAAPADTDREDELRQSLASAMPDALAPAFLRLAFHDAGTYDVATHSGGAHGAVHLLEELTRLENEAMAPCIDLLGRVKVPGVSWADLVAVAGAAAVERCGGPTIRVGLGRVDAVEPDPPHRLPTTDEGVVRLRTHFERMGLDGRDLVALSGAHTLGHADARPFTDDPDRFTNSYYRALLRAEPNPAFGMLASDRALLADPELRPLVELYAEDQDRFFGDFAEAYRRLTWLGGSPSSPSSPSPDGS